MAKSLDSGRRGVQLLVLAIGLSILGPEAAFGQPQIIDTIGLGGIPGHVAVNPTTNKIYVVNSQSVSVVDGVDHSVSWISFANRWPTGVDVNATTNRVYVALSGNPGAVAVVDGDTDAVLTEIPVEALTGQRPSRNLRVNEATNQIYVHLGLSTEMIRIDGISHAVGARVAIGWSIPEHAVNEVTNRLYLSHPSPSEHQVKVRDGTTLASLGAAPTGPGPVGVAVDDANNWIYVVDQYEGNLRRIDGVTNAVIGTLDVAGPGSSNRLRGVAVHPDTGRIYTAGTGIYVIDPETFTVAAALGGGGHWVDVNPVTDRVYVATSGGGYLVVISDPRIVDGDGDGVADGVDNCPDVENAGQIDSDLDGLGDACDTDDDGDGIEDDGDNCPLTSNVDQTDTDEDGQGDACDADDDNDGVLDPSDNCSLVANPGQEDAEGDGLGDVCDADDDNDGVPDDADNCQFDPNPDQSNLDGDGDGDTCDGDIDGDGVSNEIDNCHQTPNPLQEDMDEDGEGDACDADDDGDFVDDVDDNCPTVPNPGQADLDEDNIGDACDIDLDGDGVDNEVDNCPVEANPGQDDTDGDGDGDACDLDDDDDGVPDTEDNCRLIANAGQADLDGDGQGDACDGDIDEDGVANDSDNCPLVANSSQNDFDGDGLGDVCDPDIDGDGVANEDDECEFTSLGDLVDPSNGCSIEQLVPCESPRGTNQPWKNHGKYVSTLAKTAESFVENGLITEAEKDAIVSAGATSSCGDRR